MTSDGVAPPPFGARNQAIAESGHLRQALDGRWHTKPIVTTSTAHREGLPSSLAGTSDKRGSRCAEKMSLDKERRRPSVTTLSRNSSTDARKKSDA